jgi:hypothetical protein
MNTVRYQCIGTMILSFIPTSQGVFSVPVEARRASELARFHYHHALECEAFGDMEEARNAALIAQSIAKAVLELESKQKALMPTAEVIQFPAKEG